MISPNASQYIAIINMILYTMAISGTLRVGPLSNCGLVSGCLPIRGDFIIGLIIQEQFHHP